MGDAVDVTFDEFERCCNGCQIMKGGENTLHKTGGRRNPNGKRTVFLRIYKFFGVKLPWFWGLLKLGISLSFDKKYFAKKSLSFRNIFAILIRLN